jgi:hypothetical protein
MAYYLATKVRDSEDHGMKASDYKLIDLWHKLSGSYPYYRAGLQERAARENAPADALYKAHEGNWVTLRDLSPDHQFRTTAKLHGLID